ncbi:MAG: type I secretion C-terminal target domain-containing protein [Alphaproteobacteria bacterium]|nr:type I secretion C-terminal target domain-containing protein [Alphaproteobacteria bacterium]
MALFTLTFDSLGSFGTEAPKVALYYGGAKVSQFYAGVGSSTLSFELDTDNFNHTHLRFYFLNSGAETGRTVEISNIALDGNAVDIGSFSNGNGATVTSTSITLDQGEYSDFDTAADLGVAPVVILGTASNDKMFANNLGNEIDGQGGNDTIYGGTSTDVLHGGDGNDNLSGKFGDDTLHGDAGADRLWGGYGDDTLYGGDDNDTLRGDDGADSLYGEAGNDILYGGNGDDLLDGGDGDDFLYGNDGLNQIYGGAGNDKISGGADDDFIDGGADQDSIHGWSGNDTINGGSGNDVIAGDDGDDIIHGDDGNDMIVGDAGDDTLYGDAGDDRLVGHVGNDTLYGGIGNDILEGHLDDDILNGGDGNDYLYGGDGNDTLNGDAGNDVLYASILTQAPDDSQDIIGANSTVFYSAVTGNFYQYVAGAFTWDESNTAAQATSLEGNNGYLVTITSAEEQSLIENIVTGYAWTGGSDTNTEGSFEWLTGPEAGDAVTYTNWYNGSPTSNSATNDHVLLLNNTNNQEWYAYTSTYNAGYVVEWTGADIITVNPHYYDSSGETNILNGGAGDDQLFGAEGADLLDGGLDNDLINGGGGIDTVTFLSATGGVNVNLVNGTATGNGSDTLTSIENVEGTSFNDTIRGDGTDNVLNGNDGNDTIFGGSGNDTINGGAGDDIIYATTDGAGLTYQDILAEFSFLSYSVDTGNFYQYVSTTSNWAGADAAAQASNVNGENGYLVTITSAEEQLFMESLVSGYAWTGGSDTNSEGSFEWLTGPDVGDAFTYTNWYNGSPTSNSNTNDHVLLLNDSYAQQWYAYTGTYNAGYVVEWDGAAIIANGGTFGNGTKLITGGDGLDTLYGGNGLDTFIFEGANAFNDVDVINSFDITDGDALDISDLLSGFVAGTSDINDFIQINNSGANSIVSVDLDGAANGVNFQDISQLNGLNDLDVTSLYAAGNIIA